jgi:hypothetical protein
MYILSFNIHERHLVKKAIDIYQEDISNYSFRMYVYNKELLVYGSEHIDIKLFKTIFNQCQNKEKYKLTEFISEQEVLI